MTDTEYRSYDGSGNNIENPKWGQAGQAFQRLLNKQDRLDPPNPRDISNNVLAQKGSILNSKSTSDHFWVWGQFLDHDLAFTPTDPTKRWDIPVPAGDSYFDVARTGTATIKFERSVSINGEQVNQQSSFIDASNVYGSSEHRAKILRTNDGTGRLKTGALGLLPKNTSDTDNQPDVSNNYFLAGDVRCNEQLLLTSYHAIWVREHNRLADEIRYNNPDFPGETVYQEARKRVIALNQIITYNEFLPILLGPNALKTYNGYDATVNPGIINSFATAGYRIGHSLVSPKLLRLDSNFNPISEGSIDLQQAFFSPNSLYVGGGIEPLIRGAASQVCQELDARTVDALRNFLFGNPGMGGFDLSSLNIQRGRDHSLPSYNSAREMLGLKPKSSFEEIGSDSETINGLKASYPSVDDIDLWVGGLAEDKYASSMLGELFYTICKLQFEFLRDGDRFWYTTQFEADELVQLEATKWSDVIARNLSGIRDELQKDIFIALPRN